MIGRLKFWFIAAMLGTLPLFALAFLSRPAAAAGLWYVAPGGSDANDCQTTVTPCATINAAMGKAGPGDTIEVATGTYTASTGTEVVLITQSVTLLGGWDSGFANQIGFSTVDGQALRRGLTVTGTATVVSERFVFENGQNNTSGGGIYNSSDLTLSRSQVISNAIAAQFGFGGGIFNSGSLTITETLVSGNSSSWQGGGLYSSGHVSIISSTISANFAGDPCCSGGGGGAGIEVQGNAELQASTVSGNVMRGGFSGAGIYTDGQLTVTNSTISGNRGGYGDGIYNVFGRVALFNVTVSGNSGPGLELAYGVAKFQNSLIDGNGGQDCFNDPWQSGVATSGGYNLLYTNTGCVLTGTDLIALPDLAPTVQDNGGPAPTQALLPYSRAVNAGDPGGCAGPDGLLITDERGFARFGRCDIGAYEAQSVFGADYTVDPRYGRQGDVLTHTLYLNNGGPSSDYNILVTDTLPAELSYVANSLTGTAGSFGYATGTISWTGSLDPGGSLTLSYRTTVNQTAQFSSTITSTAVISGAGYIFSRQTFVTVPPPPVYYVYLPVLNRPLPGIQGYVTFNGAPAANVFLELRHFDGQSFSTQLSGNTDANGFYDFQPPSLPAGGYYYVRYLNQTDPSRLSFWATAIITSYTAGGSYGAGNFDLANVPLVSPASGATVALPALFQWTRRPATPSDSYQLSLFDPHGNAFGQTVLLGYVNGVTIHSVPGGFHSGTTYGWFVAINTPDGGYGESYYYRQIRFTNILAGSEPAVAGGAALEPANPPVDRPRP